MRATIAKTIFAAASIVLTAGTVAFASPAAAAAPEDAPRQVVVQIGDLNLHAPAGRATAERRIRGAVGTVCAVADLRVPLDTACRDQATSAAMAALDRRAGTVVIASR